ncbi:radical SAM protein [Sinanaerobacter chloroacetimidivorans]|uniref:Radical SAM protein n=1 Tax=Sinanaerobacter chloroacetimidivorans TaxID=2818044 RepID=A0A8J7W2W9_9FIRM|nr:radical SAM protein [Sinanaerobacter chloroacetimidivorans]MBR0599479.1 radical SAM protein [Sinanaerobacter chloroacetimidivorans]
MTLKTHPCFSEAAHLKYGRIHLPVSPDCNIQCAFCKRGINKIDQVPGCAGRVLTPREALDILGRALELCPEITVAGVAGPGDTLATDHALKTFLLIQEAYPHILRCLSTNGLLLGERVREIKEAGVNSITVTINSITAEILNEINEFVIYHNQILRGLEAQKLLIKSQLSGIRKATEETDAVIKINTVLIPGLNDGEVGDIAQAAKEAGAVMHNIIPLIPQQKMADRRRPDCEELHRAKMAASHYLDVFHHCRQCRADAAGIMGKNLDITKQLYGEDAPAPDVFSHG